MQFPAPAPATRWIHGNLQTRTRIFVLSQHSSVTHMKETGSHSHVCPCSFLSAPRSPIATCVSLPWGWGLSSTWLAQAATSFHRLRISLSTPPPTDSALRAAVRTRCTPRLNVQVRLTARTLPEAGSRQGVVGPPPTFRLSSSMNNGPNTSELSPHLVQRHRLREDVGEVVLARCWTQQNSRLYVPEFSHARSIRDGSCSAGVDMDDKTHLSPPDHGPTPGCRFPRKRPLPRPDTPPLHSRGPPSPASSSNVLSPILRW